MHLRMPCLRSKNTSVLISRLTIPSSGRAFGTPLKSNVRPVVRIPTVGPQHPVRGAVFQSAARHRYHEHSAPRSLEPIVNADELWQALQTEHSMRLGRVADKLLPVSGTAQNLVDVLAHRSMNASIANGRCGWIGNPYEQLDEDFQVLLEAARRISGIDPRSALK